MVKIISCCCLFLYACTCSGQNLLTKDGLRYGSWRYEDESIVEEGNYKIVPLSIYNIINLRLWWDSSRGNMEIRYKASAAYIIICGYHNDSTSVHDGEWKTFDAATGKLQSIEVYVNGIPKGVKEYDKQDNLVKYRYTNYDADSSITLTYFNDHVFKKDFYPPGDGNHQYTEYYPGQDITVSNAEPGFNINFLTHPIDTQVVTITAKKDAEINKFTASPYLTLKTIKGDTLIFPISLRKGQKLQLAITYRPSPATYNDYDTISMTISGTLSIYNLISHNYCAHIDRHNVAAADSFTLSKSGDKFLFIKGCGSQADFQLIDTAGQKSLYSILGGRITGLDLNEFHIGNYTLKVGMGDCEVGGEMKLSIIE